MTLKLIIAAMGRTGSNLLVRQLQRAGLPFAGEHFHPNAQAAQKTLTESGCSDLDSDRYVTFLLDNRSTGGVFCCKIHGAQWANLDEGRRVTLTNNSYFIFTRRRDLSQQALSLETGHSTGRWDPRWEPNPSTIQADADPHEIGSLRTTMRNIVAEENRWLDFFDAHGAEPLTIFYEDFLAAPTDYYRQIDAVLPIDITEPPPEARPPPTYRSDKHAELMVELQLAEKEFSEARRFRPQRPWTRVGDLDQAPPPSPDVGPASPTGGILGRLSQRLFGG